MSKFPRLESAGLRGAKLVKKEQPPQEEKVEIKSPAVKNPFGGPPVRWGEVKGEVISDDESGFNVRGPVIWRY
jgi:hypothetical protein